ncbi:MAG: hypothetical protein HYV63_20205 [Candidatus Schekmanbacteria bacterium]|nr:hypothetical protein [Candidatus Schekmanbacteria bacterium]
MKRGLRLAALVAVLSTATLLVALEIAFADPADREDGENSADVREGLVRGEAIPEAHPGLESRTFRLRHRDPEQVLSQVRGVLSEEGELSLGRSGSITIRDYRSVIDDVEELLRTVDVPFHVLEFHVKFLLAYSRLPQPPEPPALPGLREAHDALMGLHGKLSKVFKFAGYKVLDEATVRATEGEEVEMRMADGDYVVRFTSRFSNGGGEETGVALQGFVVETSSGERLLKTSVTVGLGKTAILGKSRPAEDSDALITVVSVDLAD